MIETMKGKKIYTEYERGYQQGREDVIDKAIELIDLRLEELQFQPDDEDYMRGLILAKELIYQLRRENDEIPIS